jgi:hypothetical protein
LNFFQGKRGDESFDTFPRGDTIYSTSFGPMNLPKIVPVSAEYLLNIRPIHKMNIIMPQAGSSIIDLYPPRYCPIASNKLFASGEM